MSFCFIDFDISDAVAARSRAAAFIKATDTRYGFSSSSLQLLGGSEVKRIDDYYSSDHHFSGKGKIEAILPQVNRSRIIIKLYDGEVPLTTENFKKLCVGNGGLVGESGKPQTYEGCNVHRVQAGFVMQTGDFVFGNGSGGESVYGKKFKDERPGLALKHDRRGVVSMGNSGKNSNTSQFFITFGPSPQCDGKHVVFGEVVAGFEVLDALEEEAATADGTPKVEVKVYSSGLWNGEMPAAGYWMRVPDDSFSGSTAVFFALPRILVAVPTDGAAMKFRSALLSTCVCVVEALVLPAEDVKGPLSEAVSNPQNFDYVFVAPAFKEQAVGLGAKRLSVSRPLVADVEPLIREAFKDWNLDPRTV
ncbi:hypothetical protein TrRE_jg11067 [Triparma retinervis]|uniref:peptidylprolyl isomerase n=1 Tax=Triparma retinervis TaxID=2557542 RepID=A0A9W7E849_9STRA|nr:hypothetical protein TrRE_jg11067 [Triparma retinervis]